jgi:pimeloyl-ACP methyl ester carboxylesterase
VFSARAPYFVEDLAAGIEDLAAAMVVLGNSRGGLLALLLVATHPRLVSKVIAVGAPIGGRRVEARWSGQTAFVTRLVALAEQDLDRCTPTPFRAGVD